MKTDWRMIVARDPILRPLPNSTTFHLEVWEVYQSPEICSLTPYDENGTTSISLGLNSVQYDVITKGDNTTINFTVTILSSVNGTYIVKLLGSDGKAVDECEKVTFNVNGVFYTRQTNASGIATLNFKLPPSKYVITAEYK